MSLSATCRARCDQLFGHFFEDVPRDEHVGGVALALDVHAGLRAAGQRLLGFLGAREQAADADHVVARVVAELLGERGGQVIGQLHVPIAPAQPRVAAAGQRAQAARLDLDDRHVQLAAAQVEYQDPTARLVAHVGRQIALCLGKGQRRGQRVVDRAEHVEPGDPSGIDQRPPLRVVERGRHRHHRCRRRAQIPGKSAQRCLSRQASITSTLNSSPPMARE